MAVKTSPLAGFTLIGAADVHRDRGLAQPGCIYHFNLRLYAWLREYLLSCRPFFQSLPMLLAQPMEITATHYIFLLNVLNVESVQYLERQEILDWIADQIQTDAPEYAALVERLAAHAATDTATAAPFIDSLIQTGWLVFDAGLSISHPRFLQRIKEIAAAVAAEDIRNTVLTTVVYLEETLAAFDSYPPPAQQQALMTGIFDRLRAFVLPSTGDAPIPKEPPGHFTRFQPVSYPLAIEQAIYRDDYTGESPEWPVEQLPDLLQAAKSVLMDDGDRKEIANKLTSVFRKASPTSEPISLLLFYEQYYSIGAPAVKHHLQASIEPSMYEVEGAEVILLSKRLPALKKEQSHGFLLQPYWQHDRLCAVVQATYPGHGKIWGRHLEAMPDEIYLHWKTLNQPESEDIIWAEVSDASGMNVNAHPPLMPYLIAIAGESFAYPPERCIPLSDIAVAWHSDRARPALVHCPSGRRIIPFDMGMEALESRSPMYRMILDFGQADVSHRPVCRALNDKLAVTSADGMTVWPRISVDSRLVLQRRTWWVPGESLPLLLSLKDGSAHQALLQLKARWDMPDKVFYVAIFNPKEGVVPPRDRTKPLYLDFTSPLLVDLFLRRASKAESIRIEEMWPVSTMAGPYVEEWAIEG